MDANDLARSAFGVRSFPPRAPLSIDLSSSASASNFFNREFSNSSSFKRFAVRRLHPAVLGEPPMPRRLGDLEMAAHLIEVLARCQLLVALCELADDLIRRSAAGGSWLS